VALAACDALARRGSTAPELTVAKVLRNKGYFLELLQRSDGALAAYDEVVRRFGDDRSAELRCEVAMALVNKGYSLGELDRGDEALGAHEEVVRRFGGMEAPSCAATMALFSMGDKLWQLDRTAVRSG
jgi:hypothetical protein